MNTRNVVNKILYIPREFYNLENISIYSLLKESGYFEMYDQISETDIFNALKEHSECIDDWLTWSEDKRSSSGWYFNQNELGKYAVGFFSGKESLKSIEYSDLVEACAAFIKREVEQIRTNG